jgi:hypothetical protein
MQKKIPFLFLFVALGFPAFPQTNYWHNTFWGRIILSDKITDKLRWEVYLQERTQNDNTAKLNIFKHHQLSSYWLWLHYQASKDLRVSVTPFCYFNTILLYPQSEAIGNRGIREYRWALQLEHTQKLRYFTYANRYIVEYRYRDYQKAGVFVPNYRFRYRARIEKPLKREGKQFNLILYDEVMLEFGRGIYESPAIFNQNRLYAGFSYELVKNIKFNLGYMYVVQERPSGAAYDHANVLWGILTFDNIFSQFFDSGSYRKPKGEEIKK